MAKRWIAIVAAAFVLTSCGGGSGKDSLTLVQGAGAAVLAQKTARVEMHFDGAGQGFTMDGQLDFEKKASSFTMDIPVVGKVELVSQGSSLYVRSGGAGWTKIELTGGFAEQALQGLGADPRALLEQVAGAAGIKDEGSEDIRGVTTTHYSGTVDLVKALETQGMPQAQIDQFKAQTASFEVTSTVDVYIDDRGLAHRTVSHTKVGSVDITMTMDLLDFGKPVTITVPAEKDVVLTQSASTQYEASQLMQSLLAGG